MANESKPENEKSKDQKRHAWRVEKTGDVAISIYRREKKHKDKDRDGNPTGTVSLYPVYEVADRTGGARRLQSFSDPAKAIAEAQRIGRTLAAGESVAAKLRAHEAAEFGNAKAILAAAGLETSLQTVADRYAQAVKILGCEDIIKAAEFYAQRNPANRETRTMQQAADELVALKEKNKGKGKAKGEMSARYIGDLRARLNTLAEKFSVNVDTVTSQNLQDWFDKMKAAPRTIRNFRNTASALFNFAERRGYITKGENPVAGTEIDKSKDTSPIEIYSPEEIRLLLDAAPEDFQPIVAIQAFAGLRSAEALRLEWEDVKLDRKHIVVTAKNAKTASRRIVPILPNLAKWLKPHSKKTGLLFQPNNLTAFNKKQNETSVAAGVNWKANALRHSFISYRVADIKNVAQVALEAGNSPAMIFSNYRELDTEDDAKKWFAIEPKATA